METRLINEIKKAVREELINFLTNDFVSKKEAARLMNISESTIHRKINGGLIETVNGKVSKTEVLKHKLNKI